jgi:thiol-disulfide isomerase/thioredoxin
MTSTAAVRWILVLLCGTVLAARAAGAPSSGSGKPQAAAAGKAEKPAATHTRQGKEDESDVIANPNAGPELTSWLSNLEEANRRALSDRKPLLIVAGAKWCGPCRQLATELHAAAVQAELSR